MSGAAGLSAAKRRRAAGDSSSSNVKKNSMQNTQNIKSVEKIIISKDRVLEFHEERLNILDDGVNMLKEQQYTLDDNMKLLLTTNESKFTEIDNKLNKLSIKKSHIDIVNSKEAPEDVAYFKEKVSLLEKQISELKSLVLKVQNYAMDNTLVNKNETNEKNKKTNNKLENTECNNLKNNKKQNKINLEITECNNKDKDKDKDKNNNSLLDNIKTTINDENN